MDRLTVPVDVEWKAAPGSSTGEVEGYASVFGVVDDDGDVVTPGAFRKTAADWSRASQPMPLIADHQLSSDGVIGSVHSLAEDRVGLKFKARFSGTQKAQDIRTNVLGGHLRGMSWTGELRNYRPGSGTLAGKAINRFLDEIRLLELTISPFPILSAAGITAAKAVVDRPWDGSPSRFTDDQYKRACLIDRGGDAPVKQRCSLPVREPNGDVNKNALGAAAAALAGGRGGLSGVSAEQKARAARALIRLYGQADMEPPDSLRRLAGTASRAQADWAGSMQKALEITDAVARKAAVDALVATYPADDLTDLVAGMEDAPATTADAATDGTSESSDPPAPGTPDAYALEFLTQTGPSDGTPSGEPPQALPAPLVILEHERTSAEMAELEADLTRALEG